MINEAIILAGGFGTRLQSVVNDLPKPMAPVNGQPFLNYQLKYLRHFGFQKVVLSVGHLHEKIKEYYRNEFEGLELDYSIEKDPMGTGGGIRLAVEKCASASVLILNGDSFFDIDLTMFIAEHVAAKADCSLALREVEDSSRYGTVELTGQKISSFKEKTGKNEKGLINAGIYVLEKNIYIQNTPVTKNFSIEKDFFEKNLDELNICGFVHEGYFIDIGVPEDYSKAQHDFKGSEYR
jgi:D-glycero-alpha-D-manno-heptose 1-phosphate guanylyltransferase